MKKTCTVYSLVRWISACSVVALILTACAAKPPENLDSFREDVRTRYPDVNHIAASELSAWLSSTNRTPAPLLLDVRERQEYDVSHLKDARHVSPVTDVQLLSKSLPKDRPVVAYCSVGVRSSRLIRRLQAAGHTNLYQLDGSIFQWANEGRPVYRGTNSVREVHPYDGRWGQFLRPDRRAKANPAP